VQKNNYVDWDVKTVTAGDYTVEFDLTQSTFENFLKGFLDEKNPISEIG
jgi:hypothetical protein